MIQDICYNNAKQAGWHKEIPAEYEKYLKCTQMLLVISEVIESMEGAAFFFVCRQFNLPCLQLRSVSNNVGERDKSKWKMQDALQNLSEYFVYKVVRKMRLGEM